MRNALLPVVTVSGLLIAGLLGGVVIVEALYELPGLGRVMAKAAISFDVGMTIALALFSGGLTVLINLLVDVSYSFLDPRIRLD